jgi:hypothetical protein
MVTFTYDRGYAIEITTDAAALLARLEVARRQPRSSSSSTEELQRRLDQLCDEVARHVRLEFDGREVRPRAVCRVDAANPAAGESVSVAGVTVALSGRAPETARTFRWRYDLSFTAYGLIVAAANPEARTSLWLEGGQITRPLPIVWPAAPETFWHLARRYAVLGWSSVVPHGVALVVVLVGLVLLSKDSHALMWLSSALATSLAVALLVASRAPLVSVASLETSLIALAVGGAAAAAAWWAKAPWPWPIVVTFGVPLGLRLAAAVRMAGLPPLPYRADAVALLAGAGAVPLMLVALSYLAGYLSARLTQLKPSITI